MRASPSKKSLKGGNIGSMKFKLELPEKVDSKLLRMIFLSIPVAISDLLRRDLGSQKLALQLRNDDIASTMSDSFLQIALYADLKLDEYVGRLKGFKNSRTGFFTSPQR